MATPTALLLLLRRASETLFVFSHLCLCIDRRPSGPTISSATAILLFVSAGARFVAVWCPGSALFRGAYAPLEAVANAAAAKPEEGASKVLSLLVTLMSEKRAHDLVVGILLVPRLASIAAMRMLKGAASPPPQTKSGSKRPGLSVLALAGACAFVLLLAPPAPSPLKMVTPSSLALPLQPIPTSASAVKPPPPFHTLP